MALYADQKGKYSELWNQLVPNRGKSETLQGEFVRIIGRLACEYYRNGNGNWDNGYDEMARWLLQYLPDPDHFSPVICEQIRNDLYQIIYNAENAYCPYEDGEDEYDRLTDRIVEWCNENPEPICPKGELPF